MASKGIGDAAPSRSAIVNSGAPSLPAHALTDRRPQPKTRVLPTRRRSGRCRIRRRCGPGSGRLNEVRAARDGIGLQEVIGPGELVVIGAHWNQYGPAAGNVPSVPGLMR